MNHEVMIDRWRRNEWAWGSVTAEMRAWARDYGRALSWETSSPGVACWSSLDPVLRGWDANMAYRLDPKETAGLQLAAVMAWGRGTEREKNMKNSERAERGLKVLATMGAEGDRKELAVRLFADLVHQFGPDILNGIMTHALEIYTREERHENSLSARVEELLGEDGPFITMGGPRELLRKVADRLKELGE